MCPHDRPSEGARRNDEEIETTIVANKQRQFVPRFRTIISICKLLVAFPSGSLCTKTVSTDYSIGLIQMACPPEASNFAESTTDELTFSRLMDTLVRTFESGSS